MDAKKQIVKSTGIIIVGTMVGKLTGFFRDMLLASNFGTSVASDALTMATSTILVLSAIIGTGVSASFLPIAVSAEKQSGKEKKDEYTSNMLGIYFLFGVALAFFGIVFSKELIWLLTDATFAPEARGLSVYLTKLGLPIITMTGLIGIFSGYLHSESRFGAVSVMALFANAVLIIYLIFFAGRFGVEGYMIATVLGGVAQCAFLFLNVKKSGFKYKRKLDVTDKHIKDMIILSLPTLLGVAINDFNTIIDKRLASGLETGMVSALNYSYKLSNMVLGVFVTAIVSVLFPVLTSLFEDGNVGEGKKVLNQGIFTILLVTVPATIGMIVLANPIIRVVFMKREFTEASVALTSPALVYYVIGMSTMALVLLFTRVFYSLKDTKAPMIFGFVAVVTNITLNLLLIDSMQHKGLALATSISSAVNAALMYISLRKRMGSFNTKAHMVSYGKLLVSGLIMGVAAYFTNSFLLGILGLGKKMEAISLFTAIFVGALVYAICLLLLRIDELNDVIVLFKTKFRRKRA